MLAYVERHLPAWREPVAEHISRITKLMQTNYASGRIHRWFGLDGRRALSLAACKHYINTVIEYHVQTHEMIGCLVLGDTVQWETLSARLYQYAMRCRGRHGYDQYQAADIAQEVSAIIYQNIYPCDVSFDGWAQTILFNEIRRAHRKHDVLNGPAHSISSLDEMLLDEQRNQTDRQLYEALVVDARDGHSEALDSMGATGDDVWEALQKLRSRNQRAVIEAFYRDGLTDKEIARKLKISVNRVYVLRHRALKRLLQLMDERQNRGQQ